MNKYCSNCGKEINENEDKCINCGKSLSLESNKPTNGLAIAGFVISLLSIVCCGFPSFISLGLSIGGLCQSKKLNESGKGLAIAGIVISAIMLLVIICLWLFFFTVGISEEIYTPRMDIMY